MKNDFSLDQLVLALTYPDREVLGEVVEICQDGFHLVIENRGGFRRLVLTSMTEPAKQKEG